MFRRLKRAVRRQLGLHVPAPYRGLMRTPVEEEAVALWGFLNSQIGIGSSARGYARLMQQMGGRMRCHAMPLPGRDAVSFPAEPPVQRAGRNIVVLNPPELLAGNQFFPSAVMGGTHIIGYWAWELPRVPRAWLPAFDMVDEIWTCSHFTAGAFRAETARPVSVLPHVVEDWAHLPRSAARQHLHRLLPSQAGFIFLGVFDFASTLHRKNPLGVISAFRAAFGDGPDGPHLVLKYHGAQDYPAEEAAVRAAAGPCGRIHLISEVLSQDDMRILFDAADCVVSLHRSEGFGLNIAEGMMAGRPVICTGYSGNMDFTSEDNSLLVKWRAVPLQPGQYAGWEGQSWAEPQQDSAIAAMQHVVAAPSAAQELGARAQAHVRRALSPDVIRAQMLDLLFPASPLPAAKRPAPQPDARAPAWPDTLKRAH